MSDRMLLLSQFCERLHRYRVNTWNEFLYHLLYVSSKSHQPQDLVVFFNWLLQDYPLRLSYAQARFFLNDYLYQLPVCGAIIWKDASKREWLTVRSPHAKRIGFPKGKVKHEINESEIACAAREVQEETGLDVRPYLPQAQKLQFIVPKRKQVTFFCFILPFSMHEFKSTAHNEYEIAECKWTCIADVPRHQYVVESRKAIARLLSETVVQSRPLASNPPT